MAPRPTMDALLRQGIARGASFKVPGQRSAKGPTRPPKAKGLGSTSGVKTPVKRGK